jgi:hypothetical protein
MFEFLPKALLGVILLFGGLELASGVKANDLKKEDRYVMFLIAGTSLWNMGVGYLTGLVLWCAFQQRRLRV